MKKHILLKITGTIIAIIVFTLLVIVINGHYFPSKADLKDYDNNSWMSYLKDETKVVDIVMPGSHDAGTSTMNYLGRTQGYDISTQLKMGTRYFDLRVNKVDKDYYLFHSIFDGDDFIEALSSISTFISLNKTETLILDFQHFKGNSETDVIDLINEYLVSNNLVVINDTSLSDLEFISNLQLKEARGKCIVLFGHHQDLVNQHDYLFSRNNDECTKLDQALNSCYISEYNKMNSKDYIEVGLPYYYSNIEDKIKTENYKGLFVLQGQLTDGMLIFGPYSKEKLHNKAMTKYISEIKDDVNKLNVTNIIMRDFLTYDKCENIIGLNYYKNNIQEDMENNFKNVYIS